MITSKIGHMIVYLFFLIFFIHNKLFEHFILHYFKKQYFLSINFEIIFLTEKQIKHNISV